MKRGGKRIGAGRKGFYKQNGIKTRAMSIPEPLIAKVKELINDFKQSLPYTK